METKKVVIIIMLAILFSKNLISQLMYYQKAKEMEKVYPLKSIFYYSLVIKSYTPFSPLVDKSIKKIKAINNNLLKDKRFFDAFYVLNMLKSSLNSIKGIYQPYKQILIETNCELSKISSKLENHKLDIFFKVKKDYKKYQPNHFFYLLSLITLTLLVFCFIKCFENKLYLYFSLLLLILFIKFVLTI